MKKMTFGLIALAAVISGCSDNSTPKETTSTETTAAAAVQVSGIDIAGGDPTTRPQDDLYHAVNGTWLKETQIPADKSNYGAFSVLADQAEKDIQVLVLEISEQTDLEQNSPAQKIRDFYNSYMDVDAINAKGLTAIQPELDLIDSIQSHNDVVAAFGKLGRYGVAAPFGYYVYSDLKDPDNNILYFSQWGLTLPDRDYYLKDDDQYTKGRELYKGYATEIFTFLGEDQPAAIAESLLGLETELAKVQWEKERNRDPEATYNARTSSELATMIDNIGLEQYSSATGVSVQDRYIVRQPDYLEALNAMFKTVSVEQWKQYLKLQTVDHFADKLAEDVYMAAFNFHSKGLSGIEQPRDRWKRALAELDGVMGEQIGQLYVAKHFKPEAKERMVGLVNNLMKAYEKSIKALDWMSEATKEQALDKLSKFKVKIGYPDKWKDYSDLIVVEGDLMANVRSAFEFQHKQELDKVGKPVDKSEWGMTPQTVNAYYRPAWNEIVFPAAILQPPFFNLEAEDAVNYGGIGAVIGHEIGHGFDDKGRKYDGDGNLRDWWTEEDNTKFLVKKDKLAAQFDAFEVIDGKHINGEFTSGENIGDLGGLTIAHLAYKMSLDGEEGPVIDGITADQRVFMGWAQVWRRLYRDEELIKRLTTDPHSPSMARGNQIPKNIPAFHDAFNTKEGDGMWLAPDERVKIW